MPRTMRVKSNKKRGRTMKNKKRGRTMKNKKRSKSMKKGRRGRSMKKRSRRGRSMKKRSRRGKKGGNVLAGVGGIIKEAVVPILFTGAVLRKGKKSKSRK